MKMVELINPTATPNIPQREIARRVKDLSGLTIGFLDNAKANVDIFLSRIMGLIKERYPTASLVAKRKGHAVVSAEAEVIEELASCQAVINGVGD